MSAFDRRPRRFRVRHPPVPPATKAKHPHRFDRRGFCDWCGEHRGWLAELDSRVRTSALGPTWEYAMDPPSSWSPPAPPAAPPNGKHAAHDDAAWLAAVLADGPPDETKPQ